MDRNKKREISRDIAYSVEVVGNGRHYTASVGVGKGVIVVSGLSEEVVRLGLYERIWRGVRNGRYRIKGSEDG
jgi:uncharacterized membrane protein